MIFGAVRAIGLSGSPKGTEMKDEVTGRKARYGVVIVDSMNAVLNGETGRTLAGYYFSDKSRARSFAKAMESRFVTAYALPLDLAIREVMGAK
jgi:hypothetical protein